MTVVASSAVVSILFVFFALTAGSIILYICSRFDHVLPYSVVIFAFGTLVAIVADLLTKQNSGDVLIISTERWIKIDPDVLLCSFLPALLFGEAMHLNFHQIKKAILPASLLAFPGAAFGAYILALFCYSNGLPVTWSWRMCFIVGAVLSATDPVSVVATLKGLSSSSTSTIKLTYLIVGEALLNDGMALVLFEALITPEFDTPLKILYYFLRVMFISPFLGCAFGVGCILILRMANRRVSHDDVIVQLSVTVGCAYISFFVAQYIFGVSGVICTCAAGVTVAWLGPPLIIQRHSMTTIWEFLEYVCNTLVFMVAGMIVGRYIVYFATPLEYGCIIIIYLAIFVIRFFMLLFCYPLMQYLSEGYSFNDLYFSTFAGLRGAVSLALCIVIQSHVDSDNAKDVHLVTFPKEEIRQVIFIICAVVALTILINGTFSRSFYTEMYRKINSQTAEADSVILHYVRKRIWQKAEIVLDQLGGILPQHNQVIVVKICEGVFDENILRSTRGTAKADVKNFTRKLFHDGMPDIRQFTNQYKKCEMGSNRKNKFQKEEIEVEDGMNNFDDEGETKNDFTFNLPELILFPNNTKDETSSHSDDVLLLSPGTPQLRKKHPISSTFFTRISPVVSNRKTFYGSPFRNQDNNNNNDDNDNDSNNNNSKNINDSNCNDSINNNNNDNNNNNNSSININDESCSHIGENRRYEDDQVVDQDVITKEGSSSEKKRIIRDINSTVDESLIIKFRLIFLGVTKTDYIKQIHSGRLPRGSLAAIVLLNSIDVGLETAHTDGLQDWDSVKASLMRVTSCEDIGNQYCLSQFGTKSIESICNKDRVLILTSFIAAHKHAHDTVLFYLGEQEGISTPEEKLVVEESVTIVQQAEEWLAKIDPRVVSMHVTRQAASIVLQSADDLVLKFIDEGILTTKAAKTFFDITTKARLSISTVCESNENNFIKSKIKTGSETPFKKSVQNDDNVIKRNCDVECFNNNNDEKDGKCVIQINDIGVKDTQFQNFEKMEIATHDVIINDLNQQNKSSKSMFSLSPLEISNRRSDSDFSINIDIDDDENINKFHTSK